MNIKEYIESGILEAYVLGALNENERASVEADMAMYPELVAEVEAIELAMQQHAEATAVQPPAFMEGKIWDAIQAQQPEPLPKETNGQAHKVVDFTPPVVQRRTSWQMAAIWAAVAVSVLTNFVLLSQRNKGNTEIALLNTRIDSMKKMESQMLAKATSYDHGMAMLADTGMKTIVMRTAKPGHTMTSMMFWSKTKGDAYLAIHEMPMPPKGMQYQLWVIQDGKPVSMGVISNDLVANAGTMFKVPMTVTGGQAFAISLEKEGGNPTPTDVMVVGAI
ncbi:MAG: anti-sigma factor [Bacteroidetes bacterium]|nr:anti-sigma factor [Bacteroidota bacterium]